MGNMVIRIEAVKEPGKPINKWFALAGALLTGGAIAGITAAGESKTGTSPPAIEYGSIIIKVTFPE